MAIAQVQNTTVTQTGGSSVVISSLTSSAGSGNTLIATIMLAAGATVASIDDSRGNPWIRVSNAASTGGNSEIWMSRGIVPGSTTVYTTISSTSAGAVVNVAEFSGVWYVDPLDQSTANFGTSTSAAATVITPRTTGELFVAAMATSGGSVSTTLPSGYTPLTPVTSYSSAYLVQGSTTSSVSTPTWTLSGASTWAVAGACFVPGVAGPNPRFQFPETLVQMSTTTAYLTPLQGRGVWTNVTKYLVDATLGPLGRQHELDRVQSTSGQFTFNNRDGSFNPWNVPTASVAGSPPTEVTANRTFLTSGSVSTSFTVRPTTRPTPGHLLILVAQGSPSANQTQTITSPNGGLWTLRDYNSTLNMGLYTKIATSTDISATISMTNSSSGMKAIWSEWAGVDITNNGGIDNVNGLFSVRPGTSVSSGAVGINTVANSAVIAIATQQSGNTISATTSFGSTFWSSPTAPTASSSGGLSYWSTANSSITNGTVTDSWTSAASVGMYVLSLVTSNVGTTGASGSFLYNGGSGLKPMNPMRVTAAWNGITYPVYYGYLSSITPTVNDPVNAEVSIAANDLLTIMALKYLTNNIYAQQVLAAAPVAYYRLGDLYGQTSVTDSSGYGNTMTLLAGPSGLPKYGATGFLLADANTALDLTNGSKTGNGGIIGVNNFGYSASARPSASVVAPLASASAWSFETWFQYTGNSNGTSGTPYGTVNVTTVTGNSQAIFLSSGQTAQFPFGSVIAGSGIPNSTYVVANALPAAEVIAISNATTSNSTNDALTTYPGTYTLFSASTAAGQFNLRVGAAIDTTGAAPNSGPVPAIRTGCISFGTYSSSGGSNTSGNWSGSYYLPFGQSTATNLMDGQWHYVACTFAASVVNLYIDGVLDSTFAAPAINTDSAGSMNFVNPSGIAFGCDAVPSLPLPGQPTNALPGQMQDVALYNSTLSASVAASHYSYAQWFKTSEIGAANGDYTAGRLNKALAVLGIDPTVALSVPYPFKTPLYGETNTLITTSGLNYMQTITETEPGIIFQGPDGILYAYNRQYQYLSPTSASTQAIYGDNPWASYRYEGPGLSIVQDDLDIWNDVQVQSGRPAIAATGQTAGVLQEWGPAQSSVASVSTVQYGPRTMQGLTSLQQQNDTDALALAQNYLKWYQLPIQRVEQIVQSSAGQNGVNIPNQLGLGLINRVTIQYQGQTPGPIFSQDSVIESIAHSITIENGPDWETTWQLSPYEILLTPLVFGSTSMIFANPSGNTAGQLTL